VRRPRPTPILFALVVLANCNTGENVHEPARCGTREACGGDIVGTWGIEESCAGLRASEECPQSAPLYSRYNRTGTYSFSEAGELVMNQRTRSSFHWNVPLSCFPGYGCATLESLLATDGVGTDADASCSDQGDSCSCDVTTSVEETFTGTYEVDGSTVAFSNGVEYDYCVDGTELYLESGAFEVFLVRFD
jgi:hypothetical protein